MMASKLMEIFSLSLYLGIQSLASSDINLSAAIVGSQTLPLQKEVQVNPVSTHSNHPENWGETNMAEASPRTDTSTDDTDEKNQRVMSLTLPCSVFSVLQKFIDLCISLLSLSLPLSKCFLLVKRKLC